MSTILGVSRNSSPEIAMAKEKLEVSSCAKGSL